MTSSMTRDAAALDAVLGYSKSQGYAGHNKHDGLNSPLLSSLLGWSRWSRILAIQLVMRAPWNVRPWLAVPRTRNPKGLGLFALAWLDRYAVTGDDSHLREARTLLDWLLEHPSRQGLPGMSWGYPYPWQDVGFFAPRDFPNRVVTCWIAFAFAEAVRQDPDDRYRQALEGVVEFLLKAPKVLYEDRHMLCHSYVPDPRISVAVMDVPALEGAVLAEAAALLDRPEWTSIAERLMAWVADKQTAYGAWYYTHPHSDSLITHDNYHTAIILDCFDRYQRATGSLAFDDTWNRGLVFYRDHLFTAEGAPRWMHDGRRATDYPFDTHGSASAILTFTRASRRDPAFLDRARQTLGWTLDHLYDGQGRFYYQKTRLGTKRFCLLRWCNGWMAWALSSWGRALAGAGA